MQTHARTQEHRSPIDFDEVVVADEILKESLPVQTTLARRSSLRWLWGLGLASLLGFVLMDVQLFIEQYAQQHPIWTGLLTLSTVGFLLVLLWVIYQERRCYLSLHRVETQTSLIAQALQQDDRTALIAYLRQRTPSQHSALAWQLHQQFWLSVQAHHSSSDLWQMYRQMVLNPLEARAQVLIQQATLQGAAISLLSPNALIHSGILLWRSMKLVRDIASVYGFALGMYGNGHLLRLSIQHAVIQQGADFVLEAGWQQLSEQLLTKLAEKGAQAATTGFLLRRLGLATINLLTIRQDALGESV